MKRQKLPLSLRLVRGAIGKKMVIKHYAWGIIKTKFPDMTKIIASVPQRRCRNLFKDAVAFAKAINADQALKKSWQQKLQVKLRLFNALVKHYMVMAKRAKEKAAEHTEILLLNCFTKIKPGLLISPAFPALGRQPNTSGWKIRAGLNACNQP